MACHTALAPAACFSLSNNKDVSWSNSLYSECFQSSQLKKNSLKQGARTARPTFTYSMRFSSLLQRHNLPFQSLSAVPSELSSPALQAVRLSTYTSRALSSRKLVCAQRLSEAWCNIYISLSLRRQFKFCVDAHEQDRTH
jgi:hypothetical protein